MKVLFCSHTADRKGSAISLHQLVLGVGGKGVEAAAAYSKDGPLAKELKDKGIPTYVLRRRGFLNLRLIAEALDLIKVERPSVVHLNSAVPFCKYIGLAARLKGIPVVWHIREDPAGKRVRKLKKWINFLSDRVLVVSSDLEETFRPGGKCLKVYNGVDIEKFRPGIDGGGFRRRYSIPDDAFVFGMVGTVEKRKGNLLFLEAAERISARYGRAWFVLVGGPGEPEYLERARGFVKRRAALSTRTVMTGRLSEIPEVMAGLDVLVMPSLWEGFSRTLIEALASGRPAIASSVGETPHILEDGVSGFLVEPGDEAALEDAMARCIEMGPALAAMGDKARERALGFALERHVAEVLKVYSSLL